LQCEVCGKEIIGKPRKVIIEGARMIVCSRCASLGSPYFEDETPKLSPFRKSITSTKVFKGSPASRRVVASKVPFDDFEVVEGFGSIVKRAREKLNLTPEDLGKIISEKASVVKKVESEKITPDVRLARKLEHALKVKLLVKPLSNEAALSKSDFHPPPQPTLGDIVQIKVRRTSKKRR